MSLEDACDSVEADAAAEEAMVKLPRLDEEELDVEGSRSLDTSTSLAASWTGAWNSVGAMVIAVGSFEATLEWMWLRRCCQGRECSAALRGVTLLLHTHAPGLRLFSPRQGSSLFPRRGFRSLGVEKEINMFDLTD
jgi:hypothetical protein